MKTSSASLLRSQFISLRNIFEERSGVSFDDDSLSLFERRLRPRLERLGFTRFTQYLHLLMSGHLELTEDGNQEIDEALELLTTGETYFFRHDEQLEVLRKQILPALAVDNASRRQLSIWSAGCSTGEELYSLAMQVVESQLFDNWHVTLLGGDLSKQRIEKARAATYPESAFRTTSASRRERFFECLPNGWRVNKEIRSLCQFQVMNLLDSDTYSWIGRPHLVLCRNVLIYWSSSARAAVLKHLHARLTPGGYLLLGHSESLQNAAIEVDFEGLHHELAYQRPRGTRGLGRK